MVRKSLLLLISVAAFTLAGCEIYFESDNNNNSGSGGECGLFGCDEQPAGEPGAACGSDRECMSGCFCSERGICEEAGFCERASDCPDGFECEVERASCVPAGPRDGCVENTECRVGSYCDVLYGECVPSWTCRSNEECGPGWECNENATCQPMYCESDAECLEGCACNLEVSQCVETGFCQSDLECFDGMVCDLERNTCTNWRDPGSCVAEVTCNEAAPDCPQDSYPGIINGCYSGLCIPAADCDQRPPRVCAEITELAECQAEPHCGPSYRGINCRHPDGGDCNINPTECVCEQLIFEACHEVAIAP